jgi:hypothetical protein
LKHGIRYGAGGAIIRTKPKNNQSSDNADQIKKYHDLYKSGAISRDEYEKKKSKLLD